MYRFAPSPTGDMHIGNLRVAIFNYIASLQDKSGFILRIEDTDKERNIEGKDKEIMEILKKFGIKWDTLYYQSQNLKFHQEFGAKLLIDKKAFLCFCDDETLEKKREEDLNNGVAYRYDGSCENLSDEEILNNPRPAALRLKAPKTTQKFTDKIKGEIVFEPENIDSFVLLRADKTPTYNFACAIDDMLEGVTMIIRGEDHVSNTPKQNLIREALGYTQEISYAHLPIILNMNGRKMSKRDNSSSVSYLLDKGYMPEAIANYLILIGNKTPCEIFTIQEAASWFDISNISRSPAKFSEEKLAQINREHIKLASDDRLVELGFSSPDLARFYTQESSLIPEIIAKIDAINSAKIIPPQWQKEADEIRKVILNIQIPHSFDELKIVISDETNLKGKSLFMPLRLLLTGAEHGPELKDLYPLIRSDIKEIVAK
ncbi:glutamate--tRNA ligase [Campylobacter lanienae]|uniref:glutamate--tRNA ligase n=1 Tax=Campylobacter lanienae TaxID=75658 RepID=UPI0024315CC6|nr:glutamate--tRNA ligase [Campylobacter lanienae]MCI5539632.1 glutamate--tRNA ligase [Campylobacter lanienae]MDD7513679.1 glutamate--tRNA ligase [Campylobacter lanienae]MDY5519671.1 glutamate--tRNA ligase [Campylobacter lanienae]